MESQRPTDAYSLAVGNFLPVRFQCLLQQEMLLIEAGTIAALELEDPADELLGNGDESDADHEEKEIVDAPVYLMVKVLERLATSGDSSECSYNDQAVSSASLNVRYRVDCGEPYGETVVSACVLYRLRRHPSVQLMNDSSSSASGVSESGTFGDDDAPDLDEVSQHIERTFRMLSAAVEAPAVDKQRVFKRMYLTWHPERNLETDVETDNDEYHRQSSIYSEVIQLVREATSVDGRVQCDFLRLDSRARNHRHQMSALSLFETDSTDGARGPPMYHSELLTGNPQPREARRWIRQAIFDLQSAKAEKSADGKFHYPEWTCFKCHQAVEKALKAAQFVLNADHNATHNLRSLCSGLRCPAAIESDVGQLVALLVRSEVMRYPDCHSYPKIPHEVYDGRAEIAVRLANEIVSWSQQFVSKSPP